MISRRERRRRGGGEQEQEVQEQEENEKEREREREKYYLQSITDPLNHQSPIREKFIYNQSPITNHQSPITNNQSPITDPLNHQSPIRSITNHQSPITDPIRGSKRERVYLHAPLQGGGICIQCHGTTVMSKHSADVFLICS
jgi:hypothetical protein